MMECGGVEVDQGFQGKSNLSVPGAKPLMGASSLIARTTHLLFWTCEKYYAQSQLVCEQRYEVMNVES
jgi:hypothetical protein